MLFTKPLLTSCALLFALLWGQAIYAQVVSETGLPLPRYASLKSAEVNMRVGPGKRYPVKFAYQKQYLPIKIVNEYELWRQVEDFEGIRGWIHHSLLSGRRTALVLYDDVFIYAKPNRQSEKEAKLMKHVVVKVETCLKDWCEVETKRHTGWVPSDHLWGVK